MDNDTDEGENNINENVQRYCYIPLLTCDNDDDRTRAYKSRGQEKYLIYTKQVGHSVVEGSNQVPLLDQRDNVSQGRGDPAASLFVEFFKFLGTVCLVFRSGTILDPPPALHL